MTTPPRAELRKKAAEREMRALIVRRLSSDEWMERHFGIVAHAGDVADAVLELFPLIGSERLAVIEGEAYVMPGEVPATHRRYVLRTEPQMVTSPSTERSEQPEDRTEGESA